MVVLTEMSRSVAERPSPSLLASTRMLASTGSVVLVGTLAATAPRPSCSFSRVIVNFIRTLSAEPYKKDYLQILIPSSSSRDAGMWMILATLLAWCSPVASCRGQRVQRGESRCLRSAFSAHPQAHVCAAAIMADYGAYNSCRAD